MGGIAGRPERDPAARVASETIRRMGYFRPEAVRRDPDAHAQGPGRHHERLRRPLVLELPRAFMDSPAA